MNRRTLLDIAIAGLVFACIAFLVSLGLTIFGFVKLHRHGSNGPLSLSWVKASLTLTTTWLALEIMAQTVPDTSVSAGTYDKANPSFHTNVVCALFGATAFVVVMVTEIEVVRDFKAPSARWFSRKLAFSILGLVVSLNCLRIFLAEALLFTQVEKLGLACNAIDAVTILILLLFGITAFVFLVRARAAVSFRIFKYMVAIYIITLCRLTYQSIYTILYLVSLYSVDFGAYWTIFLQLPSVFISAWSLLACLGLMYHVASLGCKGEDVNNGLSADGDNSIKDEEL
ncbi:unnamed protein product [Clonostachys rosea f. rosea IK726]|uniref:Uncharacterized protein n=2 Tax=Bionectria ochroleuca TaxID=29856 RepID=A0A0B7KA27_BIOOC|nr:unnamed protein product [Clonostachys rosea f. rosea IK726]